MIYGPGENESTKPRNETKADVALQGSTKKQMPSIDESMHSDALVASELNHMAANEREHEDSSAPMTTTPQSKKLSQPPSAATSTTN